MTQNHFIKIFALLISFNWLPQAKAQSPEQLLGQPYISLETKQFLSSLNTTKPTEEFLPYLRLYKQNYAEDGMALEFNSDIALYRIMLYDSGYAYKQYKRELPFGISWGMRLPAIEELTGIHDPMPNNEFATKLSTADYQIEFYFTNKKLAHLRITATIERLKNNAVILKQANATRLLPNGVVKEGDVIDGEGTMIWGNGAAAYQGEWSYGLPHGRGQYIDTFGNKYEGNFKLGFFWGQGKFYSKAYGYSHSGSYAMSKKHGEGRIQYANGVKYQGDWAQDAMHGYGLYTMGNRYKYKGQVQANQLTGQGTVETPEGTITGSFKNGKPHGVCTQATKDNLQQITGPFVNGKKNGTFKAIILGEERTIIYENDVEVVPQR